jgi:hypothetical protein
MVAVRNRTALLYSILAVATAIFAIPGPASAAVPGFEVKITELPGEFAAGAAASTLTVVASTDAGRRCQKVRWSMLMRVNGIDLNQVTVERVEDNGSFPLSVQANGDTARLTDVQLDPGSLCRDSTVTARYQVSFASEVTDGQVTFQAEAYDAAERLLQQATATREVVNGDAAADPAESPDPSPTPSAEASGDDEESTEPTEQETAPSGSKAPGSIAAVPRGSGTDTNLLGVGVIVGAVLIFLGVGLLLRLRLRSRRGGGPASPEPFYPAQ